MSDPFGLGDRIGRLSYARWSAAAFFGLHLVVWLLSGSIPELDWLVPGWLAKFHPGFGAPIFGLFAIIGLLVGTWLIAAYGLAVLAYRRALDANLPVAVAVVAIVPVVQIPAILFLCFASPSPPVDQATARDPVDARAGWRTAAKSVAIGIGLTIAAVAVGALLLPLYGPGVTCFSPIVLGGITAYLANRTNDIGPQRTGQRVFLAVGIGAVVLVAVVILAIGLESPVRTRPPAGPHDSMFALIAGVLGFLIIAPLALGAALIGGVLGRSIAAADRRSPSPLR